MRGTPPWPYLVAQSLDQHTARHETRYQQHDTTRFQQQTQQIDHSREHTTDTDLGLQSTQDEPPVYFRLLPPPAASFIESIETNKA